MERRPKVPTETKTKLENAFFRFESGPPVKIEDVVCHTDEYAEDRIYFGLDLGSPESYSFDIHPTSRQFKIIMHFAGRGNNWRRMHGKKLLRVPLKERRIKNG